MNKKFLILIIFVVISSLILFKNSKSFDNRVTSFVYKNCDFTKECIIRLAQITDFDWDKVYFFEDGASLDDEKIVEKFGNLKHGLEDRQIIFTLNNKVVHSERLKSGIENRKNNEVYFDLQRSKLGRIYKEYSKNQAVFIVERYPISSNDKVIKIKSFFYNLKSDLPLENGEKINQILY